MITKNTVTCGRNRNNCYNRTKMSGKRHLEGARHAHDNCAHRKREHDASLQRECSHLDFNPGGLMKRLSKKIDSLFSFKKNAKKRTLLLTNSICILQIEKNKTKHQMQRPRFHHSPGISSRFRNINSRFRPYSLRGFASFAAQ